MPLLLKSQKVEVSASFTASVFNREAPKVRTCHKKFASSSKNVLLPWPWEFPTKACEAGSESLESRQRLPIIHGEYVLPDPPEVEKYLLVALLVACGPHCIRWGGRLVESSYQNSWQPDHGSSGWSTSYPHSIEGLCSSEPWIPEEEEDDPSLNCGCFSLGLRLMVPFKGIGKAPPPSDEEWRLREQTILLGPLGSLRSTL